MRIAWSFAFAALVALLSAPALAVSVDGVPNPRASDAWVSDTIDVIAPDAERRINQRLDQLERDTGVEVAVVTVQQVDTPTPKDFATELFNAWGIGKADKNNGLLVLLVKGQRRLEMETGYGLESVLTDGWLKRMQVDKMVPHFKQGRFGRGLEAGVVATEERLRQYPDGAPPVADASGKSSDPYAPGAPSPSDGGGVPWWMYVFGLGGLGAAACGGIYKYRKDRTCPECDLPMKMLSDRLDDKYLDEGERTEEAVGSIDYQFYYCGECGFDRIIENRKWFSSYKKCQFCDYKTLRVDSRTVERPTTVSTGRKRVTQTCANCSFENTYYVTLPRIRRSSSSSSSSGGSSGGGGGFGGGSSGGGGAGSSW